MPQYNNFTTYCDWFLQISFEGIYKAGQHSVNKSYNHDHIPAVATRSDVFVKGKDIIIIFSHFSIKIAMVAQCAT